MKAVPILRCSNLARSLDFYTRILDFELIDEPDSPVVDIVNGDCRLQLSTIDGVFRCPVNIEVGEVDSLFATYVARGLDTSGHEGSPVHQGPTDQTWGSREFYVTDPDGNTLRFRSWPA